MGTQTKMRVSRQGEQVRVSVLVYDPARADRGPGGDIQYLRFELDGRLSAEAYQGPGAAANPVTSILLDGAKPGQLLSMQWRDGSGRSGSTEAVLP